MNAKYIGLRKVFPFKTLLLLFLFPENMPFIHSGTDRGTLVFTFVVPVMALRD